MKINCNFSAIGLKKISFVMFLLLLPLFSRDWYIGVITNQILKMMMNWEWGNEDCEGSCLQVITTTEAPIPDNHVLFLSLYFISTWLILSQSPSPLSPTHTISYFCFHSFLLKFYFFCLNSINTAKSGVVFTFLLSSLFDNSFILTFFI